MEGISSFPYLFVRGYGGPIGQELNLLIQPQFGVSFHRDRFDRVGVGGVIVVTGGGGVVVVKGKAIVYQRTLARLRAGTPPPPPTQQEGRGGCSC